MKALSVDEAFELGLDKCTVHWSEPWPGIDENGHECDVHITLSASASDVVSLRRSRTHSNCSDRELLSDHVCINWGWISPTDEDDDTDN